MASKRYPLGIQTFSEIVKGNYFYADKTAIVYQLAHYAKFHFLSRPRRFGKSLFVSTLKAYFEGKKELFKGLAIEQMEKEWTAYPVIHLDLSCGKYWFTSGTPTFLIELMQQKNLDMMDLNDIWARAKRFDVPTETITDPVPVLFQSGYLTIKGYDKLLGMYYLSFPNQEVRQGFSESLCQYYTPSEVGELDAIVYAYKKNVLINDDMGAFMPHLKAFYDKFPYTIINNNERHYQAVIFTIFTMLGEDVKVEHTTSDGRIDLVLKTDKSIFIFELKYKKSADIAMAQISDKDYAKAFADDGRKVVKVGVYFSEDQRSIEDWVIK